MNIDLLNFQDWSPEPVHTPLTWTIWAILIVLSLTFIILGIVLSVIIYRKTDRKFLTANKITLMASFMAFFLVQAFIMSPLLKLPVPFSIDSITTIAVGFIFGPLEGILFGWVADSLRVLINGWSYQFLPSLMYPMIGLIAAIFGLLYRWRNEIPNWLSILLFQAVILTMVILLIPLSSCLVSFANSNLDAGDSYLDKIVNYKTPGIIAACLTLIFTEIAFSCFYIFKWDKRDLWLFVLVLLAAFSDRAMEIVIRPFTQYFTGYETIYVVGLYTRLLSSTYLIPSVALTSFILIKASAYALGITSRKEDYLGEY